MKREQIGRNNSKAAELQAQARCVGRCFTPLPVTLRCCPRLAWLAGLGPGRHEPALPDVRCLHPSLASRSSLLHPPPQFGHLIVNQSMLDAARSRETELEAQLGAKTQAQAGSRWGGEGRRRGGRACPRRAAPARDRACCWAAAGACARCARAVLELNIIPRPLSTTMQV